MASYEPQERRKKKENEQKNKKELAKENDRETKRLQAFMGDYVEKTGELLKKERETQLVLAEVLNCDVIDQSQSE